MRKRRLVASAVLALALSAAPAAALACPSCARDGRGGAGRLVALAVMMIFPFAVAAAVVPVLRRASADPRG